MVQNFIDHGVCRLIFLAPHVFKDYLLEIETGVPYFQEQRLEFRLQYLVLPVQLLDDKLAVYLELDFRFLGLFFADHLLHFLEGENDG